MILTSVLKIPGKKEEGLFERRLNRFVTDVRQANRIVRCHVANTGRMKELLVPGRRVIIRKALNPSRKTGWDLIIAYNCKGIPVLLDATAANRLIAGAIEQGGLEAFKGYTRVKQEVAFGNSRFDIGLAGEKNTCLIEVKCVTCVEGGYAKFPDAPTERGTRHVKELIKAKSLGYRTAIVFVAQREDASAFTPHGDMDPRFASVLAEAEREGVEILAFNCCVSINEIRLKDEIPVNFCK